MGIWKEQFFGRGVQEIAEGFGRTRGWTVRGSSPDVAQEEPEAPRWGDAHPDYPGMVVNNVSFTPTGYGTSVRANYTPLEFIDAPRPEDTTGLDWSKIDSTFEDVSVDIPVFELVEKTMPGPGDTNILQSYWKAVERTTTFKYSRLVHRITLNAIVSSDGSVSSQLSLVIPISNQHNKIHTIGGIKYLFRSDGIRRIKRDEYQFTYRWILDPGVPNTIEMNTTEYPNIGLIGSFGFPFADEQYIVPPYSRVDTAPNASDPTQAPVVTVSPAFIEDPQGYLTLPGVG